MQFLTTLRHFLKNPLKDRSKQLSFVLPLALDDTGRLGGARNGIRTKALIEEDILIISASAYFDSEWYLAQYPGIKKTGLSPAEHYLQHGANEMKDPGPLFNTHWYLTQNPDVSAMKLNPLIHFIRFGAKEGRHPSPYVLLRKKIIASDQEVKHLFDKYAKSGAVRPENAQSSNWVALKPKWTEYFLSQGAIAYNHGDTNKSLQRFKSAIQVSPDSKDGYLMYRHVFSELNQGAISLFDRSYADARLMVAHISCDARVSLAESSALSFNDQSNQIRNVTVIGDPNLPENKFDFNPALNLLKVPSSDSYEALPIKIKNLFLFLGLTLLEVPVLKIDDNIHCKNLDYLKRDLENVISNNDYGGWIVGLQRPFSSCTFWHLNKCIDPKINDRPDGLLFQAPYASGKSYWLGSQANNALSKIALIHERFFETEIFEDRTVGTVLAYYGFRAHHFSLIDSGSLQSIDVEAALNS